MPMNRFNIFAHVGRVFLAFLGVTGRLVVFTAEALSHCVRPPIFWGLIVQQMLVIGYFSLPVVGLTAFFTGAVLCLQIFIGGNRYGAEAFVPQIVELGTMRVTEQIDALTTLSTNPYKYLVTPRLIAAVVTMPILVAIADSIGVFGGYIVAVDSLNFNG